jgi:hypothetical protein
MISCWRKPSAPVFFHRLRRPVGQSASNTIGCHPCLSVCQTYTHKRCQHMPSGFRIKYFYSQILSGHDCLSNCARAYTMFKHLLALCAGGASNTIFAPECKTIKTHPPRPFFSTNCSRALSLSLSSRTDLHFSLAGDVQATSRRASNTSWGGEVHPQQPRHRSNLRLWLLSQTSPWYEI